MKKYILFTLLYVTVIAITTSSCKKDFLERAPSDFIPAEEVFSNIESAEDFLNNAYSNLPNFFRPLGDSQNMALSSGTDESEQTWDNSNDVNDFNSGNWNPATFPLQSLWFNYYNSIRRINNFIKQYDLIPADNINPGRKERMLGEAYGLRAYYYFELFKMWGSVPLITDVLEPSESEAILVSRNSADEVIAFIKQDIDRAVSLLPARHVSSQFGRITSAACKALWSRATLYYASALHNPTNDATRWQNAVTAGKEAIEFATANEYLLNTGSAGGFRPYERIFLEQMNSEVIFTRTGESSWWDQTTQSNGDGGWAGTAPVQEMVDAYEMNNGKAITEAGSGYDAQNPYVNRDPRFYQTILFHGAQWKGNPMNFKVGGADLQTDHPPTGYFLRKFMYEPLNLYNNSNTLYRPWVLIRLSELYLNYAEALNEANGPSAEVLTYINKIRSRSSMPDILSGLSKDVLRNKIRQERRIELAFEDHRFWDVRRWKIGTVVDNRPVHYVSISNDNKYSYPIREPRVFEDKHYLFPIPQSEIDKNPKLTQNPGW
ncbi:RagB/SusD family nutrient uptake outer membrane protein [Sphingobacterium detergens]